MSRMLARWYRFPLVLIGLLLLHACGGGGGGGGDGNNPPSAPALSLAPTSVKIFRFTWTDVSRETEYRLLEDADGASEFTQIATLTAGATSHDLVVSLPKRINARYMLQACNAQGCTNSAPVAVSSNLAQAIGYVKASNTGITDLFGTSVSVSADGNTLAVGALEEDSDGTNESDNSAAGAGAVYIFVRTGTTWSQQAYIKALNANAGDLFGTTVFLSADGNTLAVGADNEDSNGTNPSDNSAIDAGAVYVFVRSGTTWSQQAYIKASDASAGDRFGRSVALSADGNTLAVGGVLADAVYIFTRNGATWSQEANFAASNTEAGDRFGLSVSLSADGHTLAVGAPEENSDTTGVNSVANNSADNAGAAYVFVRSGATWSQEAYIKASNTDIFDQFGTSVSLSADGNTLAVGAFAEGSNATGVNSDETDNSIPGAGAAYIFVRTDTTWSQQAYIKASNPGFENDFGRTVALSADGNTLAVAAPEQGGDATGINGTQNNGPAPDAGAVYVFVRNGTTWSQQAYVKASNTDADDQFGRAVSLSADGNTLAVGAWFEASDATGVNGNQASNSAFEAGAVYLY